MNKSSKIKAVLVKEKDWIPVKIDARTTIYVNPNRDLTEAKRVFKERVKESRGKSLRQLKVGIKTEPYYTDDIKRLIK